MEMIPSPRLGLFQRNLSSQSLGKYWRLNQNNQKTEYMKTKTNNIYKRGNNKQHNKNKLRYDRQNLV